MFNAYHPDRSTYLLKVSQPYSAIEPELTSMGMVLDTHYHVLSNTYLGCVLKFSNHVNYALAYERWPEDR